MKVVALVTVAGALGACQGFISHGASQSASRPTVISRRTWFGARGPAAAQPRTVRFYDNSVPTEAPAGGMLVEKGPGNATNIITFEVGGEVTTQAYKLAAEIIANATTIDGWQKKDAKKVPPSIVLSTVGRKQMYGCAVDAVLETEVQKAIEKSGVKAIGSTSLVGEKEEYVLRRFQPGEPITFKIIVDVYPTIDFVSDDAYTGLAVEVREEPADPEKTRKAIMNLQARYVDLNDAPEGHTAQLGDVVIVDMKGFAANEDGTKGEPLPDVAGGDGVEILLEEGRFMPGMVEGLVGATPGEEREFSVTFPQQVREASLSNKPAIFEANVNAVKLRELPALDDAFAEKIRPGLSWKELEKEVEIAVNSEAGDATKAARNVELAKALRGVATIEVPSTLLLEQARTRFAGVMASFREQGVADAEIQKLVTKERFEDFLASQKDSVRDELSDSLILDAIAQREGLAPEAVEVDSSYQELVAKMNQQGDDVAGMDEAKTKEKIQQSLQKDLVMDWVAERSTITLLQAEPVEPVAP